MDNGVAAVAALGAAGRRRHGGRRDSFVCCQIIIMKIMAAFDGRRLALFWLLLYLYLTSFGGGI